MMHISMILDRDACVYDAGMNDACIHDPGPWMHISVMRLKFCHGRTDEQGDSRSWIERDVSNYKQILISSLIQKLASQKDKPASNMTKYGFKIWHNQNIKMKSKYQKNGQKYEVERHT